MFYEVVCFPSLLTFFKGVNVVKRRFLTLASEKVIESEWHSLLGGGVFRRPGG